MDCRIAFELDIDIIAKEHFNAGVSGLDQGRFCVFFVSALIIVALSDGLHAGSDFVLTWTTLIFDLFNELISASRNFDLQVVA